MSHKHHVYYDDDYADAGGLGFASFDSQAEAMKYISDRMAKRQNPDIDNYTYVVGDVVALEVAQRITEVRPA